MDPRRVNGLIVCCLTAVLVVGRTRLAGAQGTGIDLTYGRWWRDSAAVSLYGVGYHRSLMGPLDWGLGISHVDAGSLPTSRTQTGVQVSLGLARDGRGPYAVGSAGLGLRHADGSIDASWSAGLGWQLPLLPFAVLGLEARFATEDQDTRGFWRLLPSDRRGVVLQTRLALGAVTRRVPPPPPPAPRPVFLPPPAAAIVDLGRDSGASTDAARRAAEVVETALHVMGTPYTWGGTDANGYDCSGLIQFAYGQHGILMPRISRDQARTGVAVDRRLDALRPGDVLGFSVERSGVTHVGLYVGDGQFIHSASGGVKLSSLTAADPDSRWWRERWVTARRIVL